ncbi:MAG: hypothetical protein ACI83P_002268 [Janthinobacterium sp.]|jgi:hypothetical protein
MRRGKHEQDTPDIAAVAAHSHRFFSWIGALDAPATARVDAGLKRALLSFTAARALNGAI